MKRGTKVADQYGNEGIVLGPEDFDGYDLNRPSEKWELVRFADGSEGWVGNIWLTIKEII